MTQPVLIPRKASRLHPDRVVAIGEALRRDDTYLRGPQCRRAVSDLYGHVLWLETELKLEMENNQ